MHHVWITVLEIDECNDANWIPGQSPLGRWSDFAECQHKAIKVMHYSFAIFDGILCLCVCSIPSCWILKFQIMQTHNHTPPQPPPHPLTGPPTPRREFTDRKDVQAYLFQQLGHICKMVRVSEAGGRKCPSALDLEPSKYGWIFFLSPSFLFLFLFLWFIICPHFSFLVFIVHSSCLCLYDDWETETTCF